MVNFFCSLQRKNINIKRNLVVFAADNDTYSTVTDWGIYAFRSPHLGKFNETEARTYGDKIFMQLMWLKSAAVYLLNRLGYSLLFQASMKDEPFARHTYDWIGTNTCQSHTIEDLGR